MVARPSRNIGDASSCRRASKRIAVIRCVIFDFDGTLVDSNRIKRQSFFDVAADFEDGARRMESLLARDDAGDRYWVFECFADGLTPGVDGRTLADRYTRRCEKKIVGAAEMQGVSAALKRLKAAGIKLFVNSATPVGPLEKIIELRGMAGWFDGIYGAPESKVENIETIMSRCGFAQTEIAMVGDGEADHLAAKQVGCQFVAVRNPQNNFDKVPVQIVGDLNELPGYLDIPMAEAGQDVGRA